MVRCGECDLGASFHWDDKRRVDFVTHTCYEDTVYTLFGREDMIMDRKYDQRRWRVRMLVLHGAMLIGPGVLLVVHECFGINGLGVCVFRSVFGVECPACGITHSVMALLRGHVGEAFRIHPAGPVIVGILALMASYLIVALLAEQKGAEWAKEVRVYGVLDRLAAGVLLAGWVGRLIIN